MIANINSSRMTKEVAEIGQMNFTGNVIPNFWFQNIRYESGKPNLNAIIILSEIIYWYRPTEVVEEVSGKIIGYQKRFKSDLLQKTYSSLGDKFGLSKRQATDACHFLKDMGLIDLVFKTQPVGEHTVPNILFIKIFPDKIRQITFQQTQEDVADVTYPTFERDTPHVLAEDISRLNVTLPTSQREYTKNTSKITQEKTKEEIKDPYKSPRDSDGSNPEPLLSSLSKGENTFEEALLENDVEETLPLLFSQPGVAVYSTSPEKVTKKPKAKKKSGYSAGFEDVFWPIVIHKTNKQGALAKWAKTEGVDPEVVKNAYLTQLNARRREGSEDRFFRRPETWLNQRGWEDEPTGSNTTLSSQANNASPDVSYINPWSLLPIELKRGYMPDHKNRGITREDFERQQFQRQATWFESNGFSEIAEKVKKQLALKHA